METILITGGTDGIGRAIAEKYIEKNNRVIVVGTSEKKGQSFLSEMKNENLIFFQANLSLISENKRLVEYLKSEFGHIDGAIFCAASLKPQEKLKRTSEGFEFTFALYYLSRYYLSYALAELMQEAAKPFILNVAAPGMKGDLHLDDLQMENNYDGQKAQFHGSRLNDLLGVQFAKTNTEVRYILFNPMAARSAGAKKMMEGNLVKTLFMKLYYALAGKDTSEIADIILQHIEATPSDEKLHAYLLKKTVDLNMETFNEKNAEELDRKTRALLNKVR